MLQTKTPSLLQLLGTACALLALGTVAAQAGTIECWRNDEGVRECGNSVPPKYSQKRIEVLDEHGMVIEVRPAAKTKAELAKEAQRKKAEKARKKHQAEQARKDEVLLSTFTSEHDIAMARDDKLQAIDGIINVTQGTVKILQDKLEGLQKQAADIERAGRNPPKHLLDQMADVKRQIQSKQAFIDKRRKEKAAVRKEYAADMKRFRELKSRKGDGLSPSDSDTSAAPATADSTH